MKEKTIDWLIVGLGNPGEEYSPSRHNTGWLFLDYFLKQFGFPAWEESSGTDLLYTKGKFGESKKKPFVELIKPTTFMNKSGKAVLYAKNKQKIKPERIVVIHDDIDIPLGGLKISKGRGSGGHRGVESINRALKTKDYIRVRVGVALTTPTGKLKKPKGEEKVIDFLMAAFKPKELVILKKAQKRATAALEILMTESLEKAMSLYN